jgi:hypothetical protein
MKDNPLVTVKNRRSRDEARLEAQEIVDRLNDPHHSEIEERLAFFILLVKTAEEYRVLLKSNSSERAQSLMALHDISGGTIDPASFPDADLRLAASLYQESMGQINTLLSRYKQIPMIRPYYRSLYPSISFVAQDDSDHWESWAVSWLLNTEISGGPHIFRMQRCLHCKKWFYMVVNHGIYCRSACRIGAYNKTPEGRAKHAASQKQFRAREREREQAAKPTGSTKRRRASRTK